MKQRSSSVDAQSDHLLSSSTLPQIPPNRKGSLLRFKQKPVWLAVCAALMMLATSIAAVAPAHAATTAVTNTKERAAITKGAKQYLHLSDSQIKIVLADKRLAEQIPVSTVQLPPVRTTQVAPDGCRGITSHARNVNMWGRTIWDFSVYKYWCWDGYRVTFLPDSSVSIYIASFARPFWWYHGATKGVVDLAPVPGGIRGQQSWAQGHLEFCVARYGCIASADPVALVTGWYDGHYDTNAWLNI